MPRVTRAHLDARRRDILFAAHRCFARDGFHATTMQAIAREAGLSAGALYRYFDGKEALIEALAAWGREQKDAALASLEREPGGHALGRMIGDILRLLDGAAQDTVRLDVRLWGEAFDHPALGRILAGELAALRDPIARYIARERAGGRVPREIEPAALATVIVAVLTGLELQKAIDPWLDIPACAAAVSALLDGLVRPIGPHG